MLPGRSAVVGRIGIKMADGCHRALDDCSLAEENLHQLLMVNGGVPHPSHEWGRVGRSGSSSRSAKVPIKADLKI